jgi:hypothetical protein
MKIDIIEVNGINLSEILADEVIIRVTQDALNLMAESAYMGSSRLIIHEKNFHPDFFDLKTGLAGDILQKFSNYRTRLSIVGDFSKYTSNSLRDFIMESNRHGRVSFVNTVEEAKERLLK